MVDHQPVLYQEEDEIAFLMPNRPETLSALNVDLLQRLSCVLDEIKTNQCVKAAVIAGSGTVFSAGADVHFLSRAMPLGVRELACLAVLVNKTTKPCPLNERNS